MGAVYNLLPGGAYISVPLVVLVNVPDTLDATGTADCAAKLNGIATGMSSGGMLALPPGTFRIKSTWTIPNRYTNIVGCGRGVTTILIDDSAGNIGTGIKFQNKVGCSLSNLTISAASTRSAGEAILVSGGDTGAETGIDVLKPHKMIIDSVDMDKQFNGLHVNDSAAGATWQLDVSRGNWREFGSGGSAVWMDCGNITPAGPGASQTFSNMFFANSAGLSSTALAGIRISGGGDITFHDVKTWGFQHGFYCDAPASRLVQAIQADICQFDTCSLETVLIAPNATADCTGWRWTNIWLGNGISDAFKITGTAAHDMQFTNIGIKSHPTVNTWGVTMDACRDITFSNLHINDGASGVANGVLFNTSASNCGVSGFGRVYTAGKRYQVISGCTGYTVEMNAISSGAGVDGGGAVNKNISSFSNL